MKFEKYIIIFDRVLLVVLLWWLSSGERVGNWINNVLNEVK